MEPRATWTIGSNSRSKSLLHVVAPHADVPQWTYGQRGVKVTVIDSFFFFLQPVNETFHRHFLSGIKTWREGTAQWAQTGTCHCDHSVAPAEHF